MGATLGSRSTSARGFEYPPEHASAFAELVELLRATEEWRYVVREGYPAAAARTRGRRLYEVAVIVMPPRAFCSRVTRTLSGGSSSASATSSRILTASPSQK